MASVRPRDNRTLPEQAVALYVDRLIQLGLVKYRKVLRPRHKAVRKGARS